MLGVTETSTTTTNAYTETPNGAYTYSIPSVPGYYATPSSGPVTVDGAAKGVSITFTKTLVATLSPSTATTQVGGPVTLSIATTGGAAPVHWTLTENGSSANLSGAIGGQYAFAPAHPGVYTFYLNATDAVGQVSDVLSIVTVEPALVATLSPPTATTQVGGSVTFTVSTSDGVAPVTYTLQASGPGLSGDVFTPTDSGVYTIYLNATDAVGSVSNVTSTVTVEPALNASVSASPATTQVGGTSTLTLGFAGGVAPVTWTLEENGSSANLSGVSGDSYAFAPSAQGTYTFYLNATDAVGSISDVSTTVTVNSALAATLSPPTATTQVGGSVTFTVGTAGGVAPVTYTLQASGPGLSGDVFTPTVTGTYTIYLNATDAVGSTSDVTSTVTVESSLATSLAPEPATTQVGGTSTLTLGFSGGVAPITWTLTENGSSANLSGVSDGSYVFAPSATGTYTFYLNATDSVGSLSNATATVTVQPALVASLSPPTSTTQVGGSVVFAIGYSGGVAPITWTLQANGLGLSGGTFTPTTAGVYTIYLNATDAVGSVSNVTATVTVMPALVAALSPPTATTQVGGSVTFTVGYSGGVDPVTWTLQASGRGLSGNTFTPTAPGTYTIYLNATDAVGSVSKVTSTVTVEPALVATLSPPNSSVRIGGTDTLTLGFSGGVSPIHWTLEKSGPSANLTGVIGDQYAFSPTLTELGTSTFYLNSTDKVGSVSDTTAKVTVESRGVYLVTFTQVGLPLKGREWSLTINGTTYKTPGTPSSPTVTSIVLSFPNGSYPYLIQGPSGYSVGMTAAPDGSVIVAGDAVTVDFVFVKSPTPTVSFHEVGLATGSKWCVELASALTTCSTSAKVSFKNLTGSTTYGYSIKTIGSATTLVKVGSLWTVQSSGTVTNSKAVTIQVRFAYLVTFTETGLASGTSWSVTSQGQTASSTGTTVGLYLTNGSDVYTVHAVSGYRESSTPRPVIISGAAGSVSVTFTAKPGGVPAAATPAVSSALGAVVRAIEVALRL